LNFEYSNLEIVISIVSNIIWVSDFWFEYDILNSKTLIWFKKWYLNSQLIFSNQKIIVSNYNIINWL
jgi:hypothetical protein